ncbi:hypothetical protein CTheo_6722 [Ceratobasidium theobromae]|uniref:Transmembrane protein n=1 Tax=Ceratobasidium theobromae TaxID=1582974 RepID=A0A5N5QDK3_9AGAM|nr:hypothetical protein CTheo_6722 [Ceratobasidium theobromae]
MDTRLAIFLLLKCMLQLSTAQGFSKKIRIDDSYIYSPTRLNGLQYKGPWTHYTGNEANGRYRNTLSSTTNDSAYIMFFFRGNSISYYADTSPDQIQPYARIDNQGFDILNTSQPFATQQQLFTVSGLDEGDHQFAISMDYGNTTQTSFSLDFLEITYITDDILPSRLGPGATEAPGLVAEVTDDRIIYHGEWKVSDISSIYTVTPGASVTFSFIGTAVYYFAACGEQYGQALVSVDGGEGESVDLYLPFRSNFWQVLTWSKTNLTPGSHMVSVTHSDTQGKLVGLDFFKYTPCTTTPCSNNLGKDSNKLPLVAIVGGSLGGALILLIAFTFYLLRQRSQPRPQENVKQDEGTPAEPIPIHPDGLNAANMA